MMEKPSSPDSKLLGSTWSRGVLILGVAVALALGTAGVLISNGVSVEQSSLRVFAGDESLCVLGGKKEAASLEGTVAELGEPIVRSSISVLGGYIDELSKSTSTPLMTSVDRADLFKFVSQTGGARIEPNLSCIVLVTGQFGSIARSPIKSKQHFIENDPDQLFVKIRDNEIDDSYLKGVGLTDLPNSYIELRIQRHDGAFLLTPITAYFRQASTHIDNKKPKHLEITVTIVMPSTTGALSVDEARKSSGLVAEIPVVVSSLEPGRIHREQLQVNNFETIWISDVGPPDYLQSSIEKLRLNPNEVRTTAPANIFVTYREVDRPDVVLSVLGKILRENPAHKGSPVEGAPEVALPVESKDDAAASKEK
jgi:hypothetical protein